MIQTSQMSHYMNGLNLYRNMLINNIAQPLIQIIPNAPSITKLKALILFLLTKENEQQSRQGKLG